MNSWIEFGILTWFLAMLPGIDTAQVLRASVKGGPRLAYLTLFGESLEQLGSVQYCLPLKLFIEYFNMQVLHICFISARR
jgi:threonine/homoserine/homoserine lactone efflux protein